MPCYVCRHILATGNRCRALAVQDSPFCWFHRNLRHRPKKEGSPEPILDLPALEDAVSIQIALSDVVGALAAGRINAKSAGTLLYGLQVAGHNVRKAAALHLPSNEQVIATEPHPAAGELAPEQVSEEFFLPGEKRGRR